MDALQANDALDPEDEGSTAQAIALLTEATRAAPQSAEAWGGLALAYAARRRAVSVAERAGLKARGEQAASRALALDDDEPRALAAQRLMAPLYRNWIAAERADREALSHNPRFPILLFVLSDMLGSVGRFREATELSNRLDRRRFLLPGAERKAIVNLWASGDLQAADKALGVASERWPRHRQIWRTQLAYLLYSGRPDKALELLRDDNMLPPDVPRDLVSAATATAQGLAGQLAPGMAVSRNRDFLRSAPSFALPVAQAIAALGDHSGAFAILDGYYFGEGEWASVAPPGSDPERQTAPLFQPPMKGLWATPHFAALLRRTGLEDYWRQSGTRPDFRRTA